MIKNKERGIWNLIKFKFNLLEKRRVNVIYFKIIIMCFCFNIYLTYFYFFLLIHNHKKQINIQI